jgi:phage gp36-like protein
MSEPLKIDNTGLPVLQQTYLETASAADDTILQIANNNGILEGMIALFAGFGQEKAELQHIVSSTDIQLTVDGARFPHPQFTRIYILQADKYRIYRALNTNGLAPPDINFSLMSGGEVEIAADSAQTEFVDDSGGANYWYKVTQYNSFTGDETNLVDSEAVRGGNSGYYCSLAAIRKEAGLQTNTHITDADVDEKRQEAQAEVDSTLHNKFPVPFAAPVNFLITTIVSKLAAGFLLVKDYGTTSSLTTTNGDAKIKEARGLLQRLYIGQLSLIDQSGNNIELSAASGFKMMPNSASDAANGTDRFFRSTDMQGYESRRY